MKSLPARGANGEEMIFVFLGSSSLSRGEGGAGELLDGRVRPAGLGEHLAIVVLFLLLLNNGEVEGGGLGRGRGAGLGHIEDVGA